MTKKTEFIPFMGVVEIEEDDVQESQDRSLHSKTHQEIADEMGVTRTAVGLTEKRALRKFKELFLKKFNKDDFI